MLKSSGREKVRKQGSLKRNSTPLILVQILFQGCQIDLECQYF